jgi:hypothetical protein
MGLQSQAFRGDPKLEAAALYDTAHIVEGAIGPHVAKIQLALIFLDGSSISPSELQRAVYGPSTAKAVLAYKTKRAIINRAYQNTPDSIVGKLTMASLDREMLGKTPPAEHPIRIEPLVPSFRVHRFQLYSSSEFSSSLRGLHQVIPPGLPGHSISIPRGGFANFRVLNGEGGTVASQDKSIVIVMDPAQQNVHGGTMSIKTSPQDFVLLGTSFPGTTFVVASKGSIVSSLAAQPGFNGSSLFEEDFLKVVHGRRFVKIAFNLLFKPDFPKTNRNFDLTGTMERLNAIYTPQANIVFTSLGVHGFAEPDLTKNALGDRIIRLSTAGDPDDWPKIIKHGIPEAMINVFFVNNYELRSGRMAESDSLGITKMPDVPKGIRNSMINDKSEGDKFTFTVAHEVGHALSLDHLKESGNLMEDGGEGTRINPFQARQMHEHLERTSR